jgi:hypothetical protein
MAVSREAVSQPSQDASSPVGHFPDPEIESRGDGEHNGGTSTVPNRRLNIRER